MPANLEVVFCICFFHYKFFSRVTPRCLSSILIYLYFTVNLFCILLNYHHFCFFNFYSYFIFFHIFLLFHNHWCLYHFVVFQKMSLHRRLPNRPRTLLFLFLNEVWRYCWCILEIKLYLALFLVDILFLHFVVIL